MKNQYLIQLGERIKELRLKSNLSQEQFAELVGVHRTYIGMLERAEKNITFVNLIKIANALNISLSDLLNKF